MNSRKLSEGGVENVLNENNSTGEGFEILGKLIDAFEKTTIHSLVTNFFQNTDTNEKQKILEDIRTEMEKLDPLFADISETFPEDQYNYERNLIIHIMADLRKLVEGLEQILTTQEFY